MDTLQILLIRITCHAIFTCYFPEVLLYHSRIDSSFLNVMFE